MGLLKTKKKSSIMSVRKKASTMTTTTTATTKTTTTTTTTMKARVQRYLKSVHEPQWKETSAKTLLLLKGMRCNAHMSKLLQDLRALRAPRAKLLTKTNPMVVLSGSNSNHHHQGGGGGGGGGNDHDHGQRSLEFLCSKNDNASLIALASHNKKRPNHLTIGRLFDHQVLDLAELAILKFKSIQDYAATAAAAETEGKGVSSNYMHNKRIGSKPMLLFVGEVWHQHLDYRNLQSLLIDLYRGDVIDKLVVTGVDHLMVFTAASTPSMILVHQRTYSCQLKKSHNNHHHHKTPVPFLQSCGPDLDFALRRTQWADKDQYIAARQQPKSLLKHMKKTTSRNKTKNQVTNVLGETLGRLHLTKQNLDKRQGRKSKALRRAEQAVAQEEADAIEKELEGEKHAENNHWERSRDAVNAYDENEKQP